MPWTHDRFPNNPLKFVVFGDITGGERPGVFNVALEQINLLSPDLVVNVGDLIEGDYEEIADLHQQWDVFDSRVDATRAPLFYVGGNHDLTSEDQRAVWRERYGPTYYSFAYKDALFLIMDTEDHSAQRRSEIDSLRGVAMEAYAERGLDGYYESVYANLPEQVSGNISEAQADELIKAIESNPEVKHVFLFGHKAPWKAEDPEFAKIEKALSGRSFTVFNGHAHTYDYEVRNGQDYIRLATTGGAQFPANGPSMDHMLLVTLDEEGVHIANLKVNGILDKTLHLPAGGDTLCFEKAICDEQ
ncbi:MAG: hypothetical protein SchgKO_16510 [Schleiferiaceae bacterium]